MTTKTELLNLLRREAMTVSQMGQHLNVTRNAINVQLRQLVAEGLVRTSKLKASRGLGKPAVSYEAAPGSEDVASGAYQGFLMALLSALHQRFDADVMDEILQDTGRKLANDAGLLNPIDFQTGLSAAMAVADSLGANTEAIVQADGVLVRNYSCPVGSAVRVEPCVCSAFAAFFSSATGCPATATCLRDDRLICQYLIAK